MQAALVAAPGAGAPAWVGRLTSSRWALVLPGSIGVVIGGLALEPGAADAITWLAFVAIPPLAALALGWAVRGARAPYALAAAVLMAAAIVFVDRLVGDTAAVVLSALSCVTLGRLLGAVAPLSALEAGIVAMATIDAILVFSHGLHHPNAVLVAASPGPHLPRLQVANFDRAQIGYGDLFIAAVLGGVVARRGGPPVVLAVATLAAALAFDQLFWVTDELPATVPVALVALGWWAIRDRGARRRRVASRRR